MKTLEQRVDLDLLVLGLQIVAPLLVVVGCAALSNVTPADRAAAYKREAQGLAVTCKAYKFDRAQGLVTDVPEMTAACTPR